MFALAVVEFLQDAALKNVATLIRNFENRNHIIDLSSVKPVKPSARPPLIMDGNGVHKENSDTCIVKRGTMIASGHREYIVAQRTAWTPFNISIIQDTLVLTELRTNDKYPPYIFCRPCSFIITPIWYEYDPKLKAWLTRTPYRSGGWQCQYLGTSK